MTAVTIRVSRFDPASGEPRLVGGEPDVRHGSHVHARADGHAVHRRDIRLVQVLQRHGNAVDGMAQAIATIGGLCLHL